MTSSCKKLLNISWHPTLQFVRFRKVNVQKPFPPHFARAVVEHTCKPKFEKRKELQPGVQPHEICNVNIPYFTKETVENPYVKLLGKDMLNWFEHSKLIAFFHWNPTDSDEMFQGRVLLKRALQMKMKVHGKEVMTEAVKGTKYEAVLSLYQAKTAVAFGPDPDVRKLLRTVKKMPKFVLLAAVIDDRLLSRAELDYYEKLPDLQTARAGLVSVLNAAAQSVVRSLNHHQSQLVQDLQRHVKIEQEKGK